MTTVLVDHDMEGYGELLWGALISDGWLDLAPLELVRFADVGLPVDSPDRSVWRFAQAQGMFLLTNNRNAEGHDSLGQTIRDEATPTSLPMVTVGNLRRLGERVYRAQCAERLVEVVLYPERYLGTGRIFIP